MASLYPKKISGKTYWYLREMARVDGKPKMVSERYLGTAAEIAAAMEASQAAVLPERTRHLAFGDVAAAWGVLEDLGVAAIIDEVTGTRPAGLPLSAGTYLALAALNRLVAPVLQARRSRTGGRPRRRTGSPRSRPRRWITAGSGTRCTPSPWSSWRRSASRIAVRIVGPVRAGLLVGGAGHDQLRHLHRYRQRQGADRAARQGQAEAHRPAAGRPGPGGHPRRRDPADLARLPRRPARRHPVRHDDRPAPRPVRSDLRGGRGPPGART